MKPQKNLPSHREIETQLKEHGIQPTSQRLAICRYVLCQADHPTAEEVKAWADKNLPKVSLATVYNTLNTLVEAGLLQELRLPHSDRVIYDQRTDRHYHFLDEGTGQVYDVLPEQVDVVTHLPGFQISGMELLIRGSLKSTKSKQPPR